MPTLLEAAICENATVAYQTIDGVVCTNICCMAAYNDVIRDAKLMTQAAVDEKADNREGRGLSCKICMRKLDTESRYWLDYYGLRG